MPKDLKGVLPIIQTPFSDHHHPFDTKSLRQEIDWAFAIGADGIGTGMVSEILRLSLDERKDLSQRMVEFANGRGPVFMAVTAESTQQACHLAASADSALCDAIMAAPPLTARLPEQAMIDHFRHIIDSCTLPLIVQDASSYVGQAIPISVYLKLLELYGEERVYFKPEASPIGPNLSALRDATGGKARIFEGSGGIFLIDSFRRGIAGTMPGMDLLDGIVAIWKALEGGDEDRAYAVSYPVAAIVALQLQAGLDGFLAIEKHLLVRRGIFSSARRREPCSWVMDRETEAEVGRLFDQLMRVLDASC